MDRREYNILFIAWDSPSVTYLEGLFVPLFERLTRDYGYQFHVIQFSWATPDKIQYLSSYCHSKSVTYTHYRVQLKPFAALAKFFTLYGGARFIRNYIHKHSINAVIPRSTMPARMMLSVMRSNPKLKLIFDADGLPIEERVDFAGLEKDSFRFLQLKKIERQILQLADVVVTRTAAAANFLSEQHQVAREKFRQVINGRDELAFQYRGTDRRNVRKELNVSDDALVLVYCGSMGPQYGVEQMLYIYDRVVERNADAVFLVITNNVQYVILQNGTKHKNLIVKNISSELIPRYLSAADIGFAIRKDLFSMKGVAPIKLGEYLLMGIPVIASARIGDTEQLLSGSPVAFILDDYSTSQLDSAVQWIMELPGKADIHVVARELGLRHFSMSRGAESYQAAIRTLI